MDSQWIKDIAHSVGFSACGIASARKLTKAEELFRRSLELGYQADMHFLERDIEKRFDPQELLPGCRSVIVVTYNYLCDVEPASDRYRTARYTWIEDYHTLVKRMLEEMVAEMQRVGECQCRVTVDSSCISEKNWAVEAGVACYGKNGLVHNDHGSFFVIGTILSDVTFDSYDFPLESDCGECRFCVEKCPAKALDTPYRVDARRCFAYHTVENKNPDTEIIEEAPLLFGCDVCQEVCPKNKKKFPNLTNVSKSSVFLRLQNQGFENLSKEEFKTCFGNTAIARRKYERLYRAITIKRQSLKNDHQRGREERDSGLCQ